MGVLFKVAAIGGSADPAGQEVVSTPIQAVTSPSLLRAVEENATFAPHGDDRHYTNGIELSYTTGSLSEKNILNAPTRWLGDPTFLFHRQTGEADDRLEWTILGQSIWTPKNHRVSNPSLNDRPYAGWLYAGLNFIQDFDANIRAVHFARYEHSSMLCSSIRRGFHDEIGTVTMILVPWPRQSGFLVLRRCTQPLSRILPSPTPLLFSRRALEIPDPLSFTCTMSLGGSQRRVTVTTLDENRHSHDDTSSAAGGSLHF
jgi:hypothetical protein